MSLRTKLYISAMVAAGLTCFGYGIAHWTCRDPFSFLCLLGLALGTSLFKMTVPGRPTSLSVSFVLVLFGIIDFSYAETLVVAFLAAAVQAGGGKNHPSAGQFLFNLSSVAVSVRVGYVVYHGLDNRLSVVASIALAAIAYFLTNTFAISAVIGLTSGNSIYKTWLDCHFWLFPYYLLGADIALLASWGNRRFGWETVVLALPAAYILFRSYRLYLGRLEREKCHAEQMADLHLRTIEALAMAIEARDATTHNHLVRVQVYAVELGKALQLTEAELRALQAASILHDIGKLAVPEHIISKPGKLTIEEFEKMKIHPVVGAEILERVRFPYPVVPIVRAHHEKWDGTGYPAGLKGTEIPIGARILSAVDYLDALASDRQYRRALPLEEVMQRLGAESGKSFDPKVVDVLKKRYLSLEKLAVAQFGREENPLLSTEVKVERGLAPAAGFENISVKDGTGHEATFLSSIAAARQEAQTLFELSQDLGASLSLVETLSVFSVKLRSLVPYDAIAIYVRRNEELIPEYVNGDNFRLFSSLRIPLGQGLSGWVAHNRKPIVNGNPSVEPGYLNDPSKFSTLRSALAIPLEGVAGVIGVLALYRGE